MGTPPLQKNGRDHLQDRDIRALHERLAQNDEDHSAIKDALHDIKLTAVLANERINSSRTVAMAVWALFLLGLAGVGWVVDRAADTIRDVAEQVNVIDARQMGHSSAFREAIDDDKKTVERLTERVRELEKVHRIHPEKE